MGAANHHPVEHDYRRPRVVKSDKPPPRAGSYSCLSMRLQKQKTGNIHSNSICHQGQSSLVKSSCPEPQAGPGRAPRAEICAASSVWSLFVYCSGRLFGNHEIADESTASLSSSNGRLVPASEYSALSRWRRGLCSPFWSKASPG